MRLSVLFTGQGGMAMGFLRAEQEEQEKRRVREGEEEEEEEEEGEEVISDVAQFRYSIFCRTHSRPGRPKIFEYTTTTATTRTSPASVR